MDQTRVFVSSTFFDLAQVRDDLSRAISELGHIPVMSELSSFAVIPSMNTIENCKRNVRDNTDLFILIIGGRRGSVDSTTAKSVTAVEYETAVQSGLDIFIFISETVLALLPIWEKNPDADFSHAIDSVEIFKFVKRIRDAQRWTFPFQYASEISTTLKTQFSVFLKLLLEKKRGGRLDLVPEFKAESSIAKQLLFERPPLWEYLLAEELLRLRVKKIKAALADLERGFILRPHRTMQGPEFARWIQAKWPEMEAATMLAVSAYREELLKAFGPPGQSGEPLEILEAVNRIHAGCSALIEWEADVLCIHPPDGLEPVRAVMLGSTRENLDEIASLPDQLSKLIHRAQEHTGPEPLALTIELNFKFSRAKQFMATMEGLNGHPDWLT
jgi:hypothetical protein